MSTFTGSTPLQTVDLLTLMSVMEHDGLHEWMVTYMVRPYGLSELPRKRKVCLKCACQMHTLTSTGDGRANFLDAVKRGATVVTNLQPRGGDACSRCELAVTRTLLL